jgi:hypothetical protein
MAEEAEQVELEAEEAQVNHAAKKAALLNELALAKLEAVSEARWTHFCAYSIWLHGELNFVAFTFNRVKFKKPRSYSGKLRS